MSDTSRPTLSRVDTFDPKKLYKAVRFQQGRPVLDTELNEAQDVLLQQATSAIKSHVRFDGIETSPFEWAVLPLGSTLDDALNEHNFGVTIGRLPTALGVVDTTHINALSDDARIAYDGLAFDVAGGVTSDPYANYLFRGFVSASPSESELTDNSKSFASHHALVGRTSAFDFSSDRNLDLTFSVTTGSARVTFISAQNAGNVGVARNVISTTEHGLVFDAPFPFAINEGDEYIVLPENALETRKQAWDTARSQETTVGSTANPIQIAFVQTWEEDISSNEDSDIENPAVGLETTHRTQLRWCVRVASLSGSAITNYASNILTAFGDHTYSGAQELRDHIKALIPTDEYTLSAEANGLFNVDFNVNLADSTYRSDRLLMSTGVVSQDNMAGLSYSADARSLHGGAFIGSRVLSELGDNGLFDWATIKAYILTHLFSDVQNVAPMVDVSVLAIWSAPSKRLNRDWLVAGARLADVPNVLNIAPTGADTLSPLFWGNGFNPTAEINEADDFEAPMFSFETKGSLGFDAFGEQYSAQPSIMLTPSRVYLKASDVSAELLRARTAIYGNNPIRVFDAVSAIYSPSAVRMSAYESGYQITYDGVDARLNDLEMRLASMFGLSGITELRDNLSTVKDYGATRAYQLSHNANQLLLDNHSTGLAQSGSASERVDAELVKSVAHFTLYSDNTFSVGSVDYEDPLAFSLVTSLNGIEQRFTDNSFAYYKTREPLDNGSYMIRHDEENGWSRSYMGRARELHEGISQAMAFRESFNFRKLAIKTCAHAEGDLFTINAPMWWELQDESDLRSVLNASGGSFDEAFYRDWFARLENTSGSVLGSFMAGIRTHLADVSENGPMGISSVSNLAVCSDDTILTTGLGLDRGHTATNTALLPFLNNISGSASMARFDQGIADLNSEVNQYDSDFDYAPAKPIDPNKGLWGRREYTTSDLYAKAQQGTPLPSVSIDTNRCTVLRLRYHVGDFYPGPVDERGVPANMLVDSLNLFMRVEPLPLVHWATMPKHQHSILEGSMDLSEAVATLLDLSNGRGIPDNLFNLTGAHYAEVEGGLNDFLGDNCFFSNKKTVKASMLDLKSLIDPMNANANSAGLSASEIYDQFNNSDFVTMLSDMTIKWAITSPNTREAFTIRLTTEPADITFDDYFSAIEDEISGVQPLNYVLIWRNNTAWHTFFDRWAIPRARPTIQSYLDGTLTESQLMQAVRLMLEDADRAIVYQVTDMLETGSAYDKNGLLVKEAFKQNNTSADFFNALVESEIKVTRPIISDWLSNINHQDAISEIYPSMKGGREPRNTVSADQQRRPRSVLSLLGRDGFIALVRKISEEGGVSFQDAFDQTSQFDARLGSLDPSAICIPNSAQPFVHWHHPNMGAIMAPGGSEGFSSINIFGAVSEGYKYQAYPEWSRESMIYTGIVPMNDRAPQRLQSIMSTGAVNYNATDLNTYQGAGWTEEWTDATDAPSDGGDNIVKFINGVSAYSSAPALAQGLYNAMFNFTNDTQLIGQNRENPHTNGWNVNGIEVDPTNNTNNYVPYFSHSTGVLGFGALSKNTTNTGTPAQLENSVEITASGGIAGSYDAWANWFPYLPSVTHQKAEVLLRKERADLQIEPIGSDLATRLQEVLFIERPQPVYLPASVVAFKGNQYGNRGEIPAHTGGGNQPEPTEHHMQTNIGYNPVLNPLIGVRSGNLMPWTQFESYVRDILSMPLSAGMDQVYETLRQIVADPITDVEVSGYTSPEGIVPDLDLTKTAFDGAALRGALKTETIAWINLYVKTYNRTYGHKSLHPYAYLDDETQRPAWHVDFSSSRGRVSGKGPDKDVDTLHMGDMGTGVHASSRAVFLDPLCLGVGALRQSGGAIHDSAHDGEGDLVFRDVFELCEFNRAAHNIMASREGVTPLQGSLLQTSTAWSKMGMQMKLLFNSSLRVLHSRVGGASKFDAGSKELNFGGMGTAPKSLTEMFLAIDAMTNKLKNMPRSAITNAKHKPYLHFEPLADLEGSHPNAPWMRPLNRMVSTSMAGEFSATGLTAGGTSEATLLGAIGMGENGVVKTSPAMMGDAYAHDPFDDAFNEGLQVADRASIPDTANNSGVEYELLSSLARLHATADLTNLSASVGNKRLIDLMPTPNEMTLPGDHEIAIVLYTGDHGNNMAQDVKFGINPPVAGCHVKASIEINRPSERFDSPINSDYTEQGRTGRHYGETHIERDFNGALAPTGLMTYSVAGGRPSLDLKVESAT